MIKSCDKDIEQCENTDSVQNQLNELRTILGNTIRRASSDRDEHQLNYAKSLDREIKAHTSVAQWIVNLEKRIDELENLIKERAVENRRIIIERIVELERHAGYKFTPGDYAEKCNAEVDDKPFLMPFDEAILALKNGSNISRDIKSFPIISPLKRNHTYHLTLEDIQANDWRVYR